MPFSLHEILNIDDNPPNTCLLLGQLPLAMYHIYMTEALIVLNLKHTSSKVSFMSLRIMMTNDSIKILAVTFL